MALAIKCEGLIRDGVVKDQAELARFGRVTRARMTQIMNLLSLAPDLQEAILFLKSPPKGREVVTEHHLRRIAGEVAWKVQREMWRGIVGDASSEA
jgi:hypothetical protein